MALARCKECGSPQGLKHKYPYIHSGMIIGILCGAPACAASASVWLTDEEEQQYSHGQRDFKISNHAKHVTVH
jgi:hypothetical protein